jgi:hypothetical protein
MVLTDRPEVEILSQLKSLVGGITGVRETVLASVAGRLLEAARAAPEADQRRYLRTIAELRRKYGN